MKLLLRQPAYANGKIQLILISIHDFIVSMDIRQSIGWVFCFKTIDVKFYQKSRNCLYKR